MLSEIQRGDRILVLRTGRYKKGTFGDQKELLEIKLKIAEFFERSEKGWKIELKASPRICKTKTEMGKKLRKLASSPAVTPWLMGDQGQRSSAGSQHRE